MADLVLVQHQLTNLREVLEAVDTRDVVALHEEDFEVGERKEAERSERVDLVEAELQDFEGGEGDDGYHRSVRAVALLLREQVLDPVVVEAEDREGAEVGDAGEVGDEVVVQVEDPEVGEKGAGDAVGCVADLAGGEVELADMAEAAMPQPVHQELLRQPPTVRLVRTRLLAALHPEAVQDFELLEVEDGVEPIVSARRHRVAREIEDDKLGERAELQDLLRLFHLVVPHVQLQ
mmetsp:Transcript_14381/g.49121  ORF Transcript_14381/g.49121 Transcript_14381/m.49121 type:complete len:234 (-) Transcript_14381:2248-2949(-)